MRLTAAGPALVVVAGVVAATCLPGLGRATGDLGGEFPVAAPAAAQLLGAALASWVLLVALAGALRIRLPGVPRVLRTALYGAAITAVTASLATPASASDRHDLDGLPLPDRPTASSAPAVPVVAPAAADVDRDTVVVRRGDTLWTIADRSLPRSAGAAQVARACDAWYRANRSIVGPDPDLIRPGQVLTAPEENRP